MRQQIALQLILAVLGVAPLAAAAQMSVCASDRQPRPVAVLERFINADCETCWRDAATPAAKRGEIALDWIVPGARGEDAPLSMGQNRDAPTRLAALGRAVPPQSDAVRTRVQATHRVRVAHGIPFNDYLGTSIALTPGRGGPWRAWLLLVEALPAGTEGSPVARNLVRNVFQPDWDGSRPLTRKELARLEEARAMQIHEGVQPSRLRVVGLVEDMQGRIRGIAASVCAPERTGR
jgi:hypothetical protein